MKACYSFRAYFTLGDCRLLFQSSSTCFTDPLLPLLSTIQMVLVLCIATVAVVFTLAVINFKVDQNSYFFFVLEQEHEYRHRVSAICY